MKHYTRRRFLKLSTLTLPLFNIGCAGFGQSRTRRIAAGAPIRVALVGCGWRMNWSLCTHLHGEKVVALVDPWRSALVAQRERLCKLYPNCGYDKIPAFETYQELFEKMGDDLDAVVIATNQQQHALPALMAMRRGIHVFLEKPIAYSIEEARCLKEAAIRYGVVTQAGHMGHSSPIMAQAVDYIRAGVLGQIRDVYCFNDRINAQEVVPPDAPIPAGMNWDKWVGPAAMRPYKTCYGPHQWYDWKGFGNGTIGNMGNHIMDASFYALKLDTVAPLSCELFDQRPGAPGSWPLRQTIDFRFPARPGMDPVTIHWYDGIRDGVPVSPKRQDKIGICRSRADQNLPPVVEELERKYGVNLGALGTLFMGEKGVLWQGQFSESMQFVPSSMRANMPKPPQVAPRLRKGLNHWTDFFAAIRENRLASTDFRFSSELVTTVLMGNVLAETGKGRLDWDGKSFTNNADANRYLRASYRTGWELGE